MKTIITKGRRYTLTAEAYEALKAARTWEESGTAFNQYAPSVSSCDRLGVLLRIRLDVPGLRPLPTMMNETILRCALVESLDFLTAVLNRMNHFYRMGQIDEIDLLLKDGENVEVMMAEVLARTES